MSATPPLGVRHPTVVPTNYERGADDGTDADPADEDVTPDDADRSA